MIEGQTRPSHVAAWSEAEGINVLNVSGNRESTSPGIGARVEEFLVTTFRRLSEILTPE